MKTITYYREDFTGDMFNELVGDLYPHMTSAEVEEINCVDLIVHSSRIWNGVKKINEGISF